MRRMMSVFLAVCFASMLFAQHAGAENPNDECAAVGGVYFDKLDGIPDLEAGEQYTGTTDMGSTVTVQFDGPFAYTVISSTLPGGAYIEVAKFGNGGGFSHLTFCTGATQPEVPVVAEVPVVPEVPEAPETPETPFAPSVPSEGGSGTQTVNPTGFVAGPVLGVSNLPAAGSGDAAPLGRSHLPMLLLASAAALAGSGFMLTRGNHSPGHL